MIKRLIYNMDYFIKEILTLIRLNLFSNILSICSTGLIFFLLTTVISGSLITSKIVERIENEAEISIYYNEELTPEAVRNLEESIQNIDYVYDVQIVSKEKSYEKMVEILGEEAKILSVFDDNPFDPYLEVNINLNHLEDVTAKLEKILEIEYIRDNREILDKIIKISNILKMAGSFIIAAVGFSTVIITSHIIRQGIYNNKDEINTLRLLGAPENFIIFPFVMEGVIITFVGGVISIILGTISMNILYDNMTSSLPLIPLPQIGSMLSFMIVFNLLFAILLGMIGSIFGITSAKANY